MADLRGLAETQHRPEDDGPLSLITWTYCSCGARESRIMPDGYPSLAPAEYPCKALRDLRVVLDKHAGEQGGDSHG